MNNNIVKLSDYASIDDIPSNITGLNCAYHGLYELPDISRFTKLKRLYCSYNYITSIDNLPNHIEYIFCLNNRISEINNLPLSLLGLFCSSNRIRYIKYLPYRLRRLFCNNNRLISLPDLPYLMDVMYCNNNFFYCLPYLPYSLSYLSCNYIPNIYPYANFYAINIVNQLRFNYYSIKYGHKLFFYVLKKKMQKYKRELLETSAKLVLHPNRIAKILEEGYHSIEDFADNL